MIRYKPVHLLLKEQITALFLAKLRDSDSETRPQKVTLCLDRLLNSIPPFDESQIDLWNLFFNVLTKLTKSCSLPLIHPIDGSYFKAYGPLFHSFQIYDSPCWRVDVTPNYETFDSIEKDCKLLLPTPSKALSCYNYHIFSMVRLVLGFESLGLQPRFYLSELNQRLILNDPFDPDRYVWSPEKKYDPEDDTMRYETLDEYANAYIDLYVVDTLTAIAYSFHGFYVLLEGIDLDAEGQYFVDLYSKSFPGCTTITESCIYGETFCGPKGSALHPATDSCHCATPPKGGCDCHSNAYGGHSRQALIDHLKKTPEYTTLQQELESGEHGEQTITALDELLNVLCSSLLEPNGLAGNATAENT